MLSRCTLVYKATTKDTKGSSDDHVRWPSDFALGYVETGGGAEKSFLLSRCTFDLKGNHEGHEDHEGIFKTITYVGRRASVAALHALDRLTRETEPFNPLGVYASNRPT